MSNLPANEPTPRRSRHDLSPASYNPNTIRMLIDRGLVSWKLLWDNRVGILPKLIPLLTLAYVISPIDLIPDFIPVIGYVDDVTVIALVIRMIRKDLARRRTLAAAAPVAST